MPAGLKADYFELFDLPRQFRLDETSLHESFRNLQRTFHPDRYVNADDCERRISVQMAARVNEAFDHLRNPLKRAVYLVHLRGHDASGENRSTSDVNFLMAQLEYRERLELLQRAEDPLAELSVLRRELSAEMNALYDSFELAFEADDLPRALAAVQKLQFFQKLKHSLGNLEAQLEDELL